MNVCFIGHFQGSRDEGVRSMAKEIFKLFEDSNHNVISIDIHNWIKKLHSIRKFNPTIIHFILNPTMPGLLVVRVFSIIFPNSKIIVSCIQPSIKDHWLLNNQRIDLALVQDDSIQVLLTNRSIKTKKFYNFVDIERFTPVSNERKIELRKKYEIPLDKFLIVHLGSLKQERNISLLVKLKETIDCNVLLIGRENEPIDAGIYDQLVDSGCFVWIKHFDRINDIYNMADCYVFPTVNDKACISTPLSVLEAMSCNIPIVTTRFGALPSIFHEGNGYFYFDTIDDAVSQLEKVVEANELVETRSMVEGYSKINAYNTLNEIFREVSI